MAEIAPIRGILYDPARVEISRVIAPPYDVISEEERIRLEALDPRNCVRLILPRGEGDEKYGNAARTFEAWRHEGVLRRDEVPALYLYHQVFTSLELGPDPVTRRGFICGVRLHAFDEDVILPHERTLRGPKEDRLKLMRATRAHFSQIFALYPDPRREIDPWFEATLAHQPDLEGRTADGTLHRLWRVTDRATIEAVARLLEPRRLYIADGHHRYETMLALRDEFRRTAGGRISPRATTEFGTLFLANMDDPGLVVLPTHRLVHSLPSFDRAEFLARVAEHFVVEVIPEGATDAVKVKTAIAERSARGNTFALVLPGDARAYLLTLRSTPEAAGLTGPRALTSLDVTVLHSLVLERLLGIDREALEAQRNLAYVKDTREALERVARGEAQAGFLMHPTPVAQVRAVADAHEVMPQKSTFFYPKIASGLVINPLDPSELL